MEKQWLAAAMGKNTIRLRPRLIRRLITISKQRKGRKGQPRLKQRRSSDEASLISRRLSSQNCQPKLDNSQQPCIQSDLLTQRLPSQIAADERMEIQEELNEPPTPPQDRQFHIGGEMMKEVEQSSDSAESCDTLPSPSFPSTQD